MAYGDSTRTRSLAGNPSTTNVSAGDVTQAIAYGDAMVNGLTGYSSWTNTDSMYAAVQTASEYFASHYIRSRFEDKDNKSLEHRAIAKDICEDIRKNGNGVFIVTQGYRTYPLNEDATPYRSISGANNSVDDSDLTS